MYLNLLASSVTFINGHHFCYVKRYEILNFLYHSSLRLALGLIGTLTIILSVLLKGTLTSLHCTTIVVKLYNSRYESYDTYHIKRKKI